MSDPRLAKLADALINFALGIKAGEELMIASPVGAEPLLYEVVRAALKAGAHITTRLGIEDLRELELRESSEAQLTHISEIAKFEIDHIDAYLSIRAPRNTRNLSGIDPKRMSLANAGYHYMLERITERTAKGELRWCVTQYPTHAAAQDAGMSLHDYEEFIFNGCLLDQADPVAAWKAQQAEQQRIIDYLSKHDSIHVVAPGTDLTYRVGGRIWVNADGHFNFPDGEVFTGPIEDSVQGTISFTYPLNHMGNEVDGIQLTFKDGKAVEAKARNGAAFLNTMLDMDEGARYVGEVAFGTNYGVKQFTKNTLFDEKIGGTMHMALGNSYPETGGVNKSGLHWDMVCDLREGKVYADGELFYEAGHFVI
ncbi:MAG: aminopeptidase [Anaerolineae bacterium]|nr:aminopeptidase [Anaerolineae bacterium]